MRRSRASVVLAAAALLVASALAQGAASTSEAPAIRRADPEASAAQDSAATPYSRRPPASGGTGKVFRGREIAAVMGWQGAAWLERAEREQEERTDLLLQALALAPGMHVADIGAGSGFVTRRLARAVGEHGVVDAVDVQPEMVRLLEEHARRDHLAQVHAVLGSERDVGLRPASVDVAVLVDVYHELAFPREVMQSIVRALKPGGRVVLVEYRAEDPRVPIQPLHKMSVAQIRREMAGLPLRLERVVETLPWQHIVELRKTA